MSEVHRVSVDIGGTEITFETGRLAKQASGSVVVSAGETMVLGTATAGNPRDVDFLPLSIDHVVPYDILAMNGASAALMVSNIPFPTPVGAVRIGKVEGNFVVNPTEEQLLTADMDLVVAGTDEAVLMVECGANEVTEAEILDALDIAHSAIKQLCDAQLELRKIAGKPKVELPEI